MDRTNNKNMRTLTGWRCDSCGRLITSIDDGWVEWLALEADHGTTILGGLRLVHSEASDGRGPKRTCRYDSRKEFRANGGIVEGLSLDRFVGPDGLMLLLLSFINAGEFRKEDILELAKRVQIPGYEFTREIFRQPIARGFCTPVLGDGYYLQSEMREVLTWANAAAAKTA